MTALVWAVQKAVFMQLSNDAGVKLVLGDPPRIHDDAPASAVFPYAILGEGRAAPLDGVDGAFEHDVRIGIFSRYQGRREVKQIVDALYDALHDAVFLVDGATLISSRFVFGDVFRREPNEAYRGVARFRVVTQV